MLEELVPSAAAQAIKDADTFLAVELPALTEWGCDAEQAGSWSTDGPAGSVIPADPLRKAGSLTRDCPSPA